MKEKELIYPVGKETLIIPQNELEEEYIYNEDDQEISDEEMAEIEAIFEERKDRNDWSSGEELAKKSSELYMKFAGVKATLEISGFVVTKEMEKLIMDNVTGKISDEEFFKRAKEF